MVVEAESECDILDVLVDAAAQDKYAQRGHEADHSLSLRENRRLAARALKAALRIGRTDGPDIAWPTSYQAEVWLAHGCGGIGKQVVVAQGLGGMLCVEDIELSLHRGERPRAQLAKLLVLCARCASGHDRDALRVTAQTAAATAISGLRALVRHRRRCWVGLRPSCLPEPSHPPGGLVTASPHVTRGPTTLPMMHVGEGMVYA